MISKRWNAVLAAILALLVTHAPVRAAETHPAGIPHPRATFVVTVKHWSGTHVKLSTWTTVPIRPNGTVQTVASPKAVPSGLAHPRVSRIDRPVTAH